MYKKLLKKCLMIFQKELLFLFKENKNKFFEFSNYLFKEKKMLKNIIMI